MVEILERDCVEIEPIKLGDVVSDVAKNIAAKVLSKIEPYFEGGMLKRTTADISVSEDFYVFRNEEGEVIGCFEIRKYCDGKVWEMGTVWGKGMLKDMFVKFEELRKEAGIGFGFAVTKSMETAEKFEGLSNGDIAVVFPDWFKKETHDRVFVGWG